MKKRDEFRTAVNNLDEGLEAANEVIRGMHHGVDAEIQLTDTQWLRWSRIGDKKRTLHVFDADAAQPPEGFKRVNIEVRMLAAGEIPSLLELLRANRAGKAAKILNTSRKLDAFVEAMVAIQEENGQ